MAALSPNLEEDNSTTTAPDGRAATILAELNRQRRIAIPLIPMNSTWFYKTAITTATLGRLGSLQLAAGMLGLTFANVTGLSILNGLCMGMEPICGQANGSKNRKLLHKTLFKGVLMLLLTCLPVSVVWLHVDKIFLLVGQRRDMAVLAKRYVLFLLPDLPVVSFMYPLRTYLSSQGTTLPILLCSIFGLAFHLPFNILLSRKMGVEGVPLATVMTDLITTTSLAAYALAAERRRRKRSGGGGGAAEEGGEWWEQRLSDWLRLVVFSTQLCFKACFEWWCYEILILLSGRLHNARRSVAVLTLVLNFDYFTHGFMLSVATSVSARVSNELGAGAAGAARTAALVALGVAGAGGVTAVLVIVAVRSHWGALFSHDREVIDGVRDLLPVLAAVEMFNFMVVVCGGIIRGTTRPGLGMWSVLGFYLVGLPLAVALGFKTRLGLEGMLIGLAAGMATGTAMLGVVVARIKWVEEAARAQKLGGEGRAAERMETTMDTM